MEILSEKIKKGFEGKPPRVALLSTTRAIFGPMETAFHEDFPEAQFLHLLDETLLEDFRREGGLSPCSRSKALRMALTAQEAGVDAILVTCSTLSPAVEDFRPFVTTPIVRIDEPTVDVVLKSADEVGLLASAETVLKSYEPFILKKASVIGRKVTIRRFVEGEIWPLLLKDPQAFYRAVGEAATKAAKACQAVIIGQVSMAPGWDYVERSVRDKVYAMPAYAVRALRRLLKGSSSG
jgi:Asp/Glu/hydantoin racemase